MGMLSDSQISDTLHVYATSTSRDRCTRHAYASHNYVHVRWKQFGNLKKLMHNVSIRTTNEFSVSTTFFQISPELTTAYVQRVPNVCITETPYA